MTLRSTKYPNIIGEKLNYNGRSRDVDNIVALISTFFDPKKINLAWMEDDNPYAMLLPLADYIEDQMSLADEDYTALDKIKKNIKKEVKKKDLKVPTRRPMRKTLDKEIQALFSYLNYPLKSVFRIGAFNVRIKGNVQASGILDSLRNISKLNFPNEFKEALYGDILISDDDGGAESKSYGSTWAALYYRNEDQIRIRASVAEKSGPILMMTLIHEIGHRYFQKFMSNRVNWSWIDYDQYCHSPESKSELQVGDDVNIFISEQDQVPVILEFQAEKSVPTKVSIIEDNKFWVKPIQGPDSDITLFQYMNLNHAMNKKSFGPFDLEGFSKSSKGLFPTKYATTDYEEHFCEAFAHYILGKLKSEAKYFFEKIIIDKESFNKIKRNKSASSQASWSILSQGVSAARVEAHIVRTHINQMIEAIKENPTLAEEIYKICGDNFEAIPKHTSKLERSLDRTNYALITMGSDWYRQRLTHEDREIVDMAAKYNPTPTPSTNKQSSAQRLALRYLLEKKTR
jgi:hypothetical protein